MAFSVATNNRFDLFVDEDEEPDELVSKQQRQAVAERQRKDSEKKLAKVKTGSKQAAPGKAQTQAITARPPSNSSTTVKATSSPGNVMTPTSSSRRDAGRHMATEAAARQDLASFRERSDGERESRGGPNIMARRGRGTGGRGSNSAQATDGGFDRFGKREFERHSGSDKTGLKAIEKRSGGGAHNWGNITDAVKDAEDTEPRSTLNKTGATDVRQADDEDAVEAEETSSLRQLTLDEWKALQHDKRPAATTTFNIRKSGEGYASDPRWKDMELLKKKHGADEMQPDDSTGQFDDVEEDLSRTLKSVVQIPVTFADSDRHSGRGRGRGSQQQRVVSRREQPTTLGDVAPPNVDSEQDFPSLS